MAEHQRQDNAQAGRDSALRISQSIALFVGVGVCLVLSAGFAMRALGPTESSPVAGAGERINPNDAPVASLMRLPQVGAARARAIVAHRDHVGSETGRQPAFRTADDLQRIKGFGPTIVEGLRPWLQFDTPPVDGKAPPQK